MAATKKTHTEENSPYGRSSRLRYSYRLMAAAKQAANNPNKFTKPFFCVFRCIRMGSIN